MSEPSSEKLSISFPAGTKAELKALVDSGAIPSVSAFVAQAVTDRLRRERFDRKISALRKSDSHPAEAIEWACRVLGATLEQTAAMHAKYDAPGTQETVAS